MPVWEELTAAPIFGIAIPNWVSFRDPAYSGPLIIFTPAQRLPFPYLECACQPHGRPARGPGCPASTRVLCDTAAAW